MVHSVSFLSKRTLEFHSRKYQISSTMDPLNTGNGILCCNIGYPFLLECFIPYLTSIGRGGERFYSIYSTIEVHIVSFLSKTAPKLHAKEYQISGTLSAQETGYRAASRDIYCCLSVSHTSLDIMMSRAADDSSLYKTLMVHTMSFLPKTTIKFHAKCHISGTL